MTIHLGANKLSRDARLQICKAAARGVDSGAGCGHDSVDEAAGNAVQFVGL